MPIIKLPQRNISIPFESGKNLMDILLENGLPVASSCRGEGVCSKCSVLITPAGSHTKIELKTLEKNKIDLARRLSCQVFITEDCSVETTYW